MAIKGLIPSLLLFIGFFAIIDAQCSENELQSRISTCSSTTANIINSNQCINLEEPIRSVFKCFDGCGANGVPQKYTNELTDLNKAIEKAVVTRCPPVRSGGGPAEARDGGAPAAACGFTEGLTCITGVTDLTNIPSNVALGNVQGICNVITGLSGFINNCGRLILDCIDQFAGLGFDANGIRNGMNIALELSKGGCTCAGQINTAVAKYTGLPTTGSQVCPIIQATTETVRGVLDGCVDKLSRAVGYTSLDWLGITLTAIDIANPVIGGICGTTTILTRQSAASSIQLSLLLSAAIVLVHLLRRQ